MSAKALWQEMQKLDALLREVFPRAGHINVSLRNSGRHEISVHGCSDYAAAVRFASAVGAKISGNQFHSPESPWSVLLCMLGDDLELCFFCQGLPPTCEIVTKTERIPKQETVDTGEFIEITRQEIRCMNADEEAA